MTDNSLSAALLVAVSIFMLMAGIYTQRNRKRAEVAATMSNMAMRPVGLRELEMTRYQGETGGTSSGEAQALTSYPVDWVRTSLSTTVPT